MVAVIKTGHSIRRILHYNENKVKEGVAACLQAENYPMMAEDMTFAQKLNRLEKQAALNENVSRNSVHISLNFAPGEALTDSQLNQIAAEYMEQIGFGEQPYLVYRHNDAGHPHIHIVSVKVRADGSRIDTQNIGRNQSEKARKSIENKYGLIKAEDHKAHVFSLKPVNIQKAQYGKTQTKRAISNILDGILQSYKYTSIPELNAILNQYNVLADRCGKESRTYQRGGLFYRLLDGQAKPVGVPIKASDFYNKPTLKYLEKRFAINEKERDKYKSRVKNAIDINLRGPAPPLLVQFIKALEKEGIHSILRQNEQGAIYGITYVDHTTHCVFNGSALGKSYSANAIQERCGSPVNENKSQEKPRQPEENSEPKQDGIHRSPMQSAPKTETDNHENEYKPGHFLETLLQPESIDDSLPFELKRSRKRKKRKQINHNQN